MAIDIIDAFETSPPPIDFVLPGMVAGSVGAIVSPGGAGKSMAAFQLAAQLSGGPDTLGWGNFPTGKVVYLPAEDPKITILHRLHSLGAHVPQAEREAVAERLVIEPLIGREINLLDPLWTDALMRAATDGRLLILDTLRRFHQAEENDSGAMAEIVGRLEAIAAQTGCSVVFLHHSSKAAALGGQGDQQQASRGSSVLTDNIRWQAFLSGMTPAEAEKLDVHESQRSYFVRFGVSKQNYGPPVADMWLRRAEGGVLVPAELEAKPNGKKKGGRRDDV